MVAIMIPNIVAAIKKKDCFKNEYNNKAATVCEQIGRYACFVLMIFNIPYTYIGFYFLYGKIVYLVVNAALAIAYDLVYIITWNKSGIVKAILLSCIPSLIFIFSGAMVADIPLFVFAVIFSVCHILISVKNARIKTPHEKVKKKSVITITSLLLSVVIVFSSAFGGAYLARQNEVNSFLNMSASELIAYDCKDKDVKISVAIIENGNVTFHIYGHDGEESNIYDYEIGSISKTFVGLMCAKAVSEGKILLSDSIAKYLDLGNSKYYPTIERLLTHTSGYDAYYFESQMISNKFAQIENDFYGISKARILNKVKSISLQDKDYPFNYSNFGISVVGLVLEKIYSDSFTNLMNEYIQTQLNLSDTKVAKQNGNLSGYWQWKNNDGYIPAGAIISNITDMAAYLNIYLNDTVTYASQTYTEIKAVNVSAGMNEKFNVRVDSIGYTWILDNKNDIVWHNGATTNFNSYMGFTKDKKKGVVVLGNINSEEKASMTIIGTKLLTE
jgi:CubicO group peptidase (beta-lactamase class C family)